MVAVVYMLIITRYGKKKNVSNHLLKFDEIENLHELYGRWDIIAKIKAKDMAALEGFIQKNIRTMPDIHGTETLVISDIPKEGEDILIQ